LRFLREELAGFLFEAFFGSSCDYRLLAASLLELFADQGFSKQISFPPSRFSLSCLRFKDEDRVLFLSLSLYMR